MERTREKRTERTKSKIHKGSCKYSNMFHISSITLIYPCLEHIDMLLCTVHLDYVYGQLTPKFSIEKDQLTPWALD
jgi:hypothetical protein